MAGKKPFTDTLVSLRYGTLHDDLTDALNKLTDDVTRTNKVGQLTLTIKLKPTNNSGQIEIIDDIKVQTPKDTKGTNSAGVPYLSRIPIIGGLFGTKGVTNERQEVIVLVTPTIVRDPTDARKLTDEYGSRFRALDPLRKPTTIK